MERIVFAIKTSHYAIKTNKLSSKVWSNPSGQQNYSTSPRNRVWNLEVYNLTNFPFFDLMETLIFLYLSTKICNNNNEYKCTNVSYDWMYKYIIWSKNVLIASTWKFFKYICKRDTCIVCLDDNISLPVSFKWVVGDIHLRSIHCNCKSHLGVKSHHSSRITICVHLEEHNFLQYFFNGHFPFSSVTRM